MILSVGEYTNMSNGDDNSEKEAPKKEQLANNISSPEDITLNILDGATSYSPAILSELEMERALVMDRTKTMEERLEAYANIIDSEVGDTPLTRARNIEREAGLRQIYLKFEGFNPTGTQKDRIAFAQAQDALRRGYEGVSVATCGNYGVAMALACNLAGLRCVCYIPSDYHTKRIMELKALGAEIERVPGDYEAAIDASHFRARTDDDLYDGNPGGTNTPIQLAAYGTIAYEIYDELRDAPAICAVPVSNGTTLAGIYKGFVSLYRRGKTSRIPKMVAGSSYGKNPIVQAFQKNLAVCENLSPEKIKSTEINEPLINWQSIDGDDALNSIRTTNGWASYASDKALRTYSKSLREREGLSVLPASTASLIALLDQHKKNPFPGDRYVVILTGRKA